MPSLARELAESSRVGATTAPSWRCIGAKRRTRRCPAKSARVTCNPGCTPPQRPTHLACSLPFLGTQAELDHHAGTTRKVLSMRRLSPLAVLTIARVFGQPSSDRHVRPSVVAGKDGGLDLVGDFSSGDTIDDIESGSGDQGSGTEEMGSGELGPDSGTEETGSGEAGPDSGSAELLPPPSLPPPSPSPPAQPSTPPPGAPHFLDRSPCQPRCYVNTRAWDNKCFWTNGVCSGCPECLTPPAAPPPSPSPPSDPSPDPRPNHSLDPSPEPSPEPSSEPSLDLPPSPPVSPTPSPPPKRPRFSIHLPACQFTLDITSTAARRLEEPPPSSADSTGDQDPFCVDGRQIPQLFLLGAQKCGTTSFAKAASQYGVRQSLGVHDGGAFSNSKEPHFFDTPARFERGLEGYASSFPLCGKDVLTMDATPDYLFNNGSLGRLARMYGRARLERTTFAVLLCEPLQRTQSAFYHVRARPVPGVERPASATFADFVAADKGAVHPLWAHGRYGLQLDAILAQLGQVAILPAAWYLASPHPTLIGLLDLVRRRCGRSLPHAPVASPQAAAIHAFAGKHPPLADELPEPTLSSLAQTFRMSNERAYELAYSDDPRVSLIPPVPSFSRRFLDRNVAAVEKAVVPLVSIVTLVTAERAGYLRLVLEQVQRQTYPRLEVVVVDDLSADLSVVETLASFPTLEISYRLAASGSSVGHKRNLACSVARGAVVVTWDADDQYSDTRVAVQACLPSPSHPTLSPFAAPTSSPCRPVVCCPLAQLLPSPCGQVGPILSGRHDVNIFRFRFYAWVSPTSIEYYEAQRSRCYMRMHT